MGQGELGDAVKKIDFLEETFMSILVRNKGQPLKSRKYFKWKMVELGAISFPFQLIELTTTPQYAIKVTLSVRRIALKRKSLKTMPSDVQTGVQNVVSGGVWDRSLVDNQLEILKYRKIQPLEQRLQINACVDFECV